MNQLQRDFGAYRAKMALMIGALSCAAIYERKDAPDVKSISDAIDKIGRAFDEYKATNDARIEAVKKGASTEALDAKLARMDEYIDAMTDAKSRLEKLEIKLARPGNGYGDQKQGESREAVEYKEAFVAWMRNPADAERKQAVHNAGRALEQRARETKSTAVVTSTGAAGGFALPEQIERSIASLSVDISPIRSISTVRMVGTSDYKELFNVNGAGFEWIGETDTRAQTNTPDLAEVAPTFGMASAKPQASEESLDDLFFNVEDWLVSSVAETLAQGEGAAFVSGNGTKKPTGFLGGPTPVTTVDASRAFGTLQYVFSGQAAAMPTTLDTFVDMIYSLRARYRANATWVTNKLILAALRKYKEATTNAYMWAGPTAAGQPSTFFGFPIVEAEDMPAVAANAFPLAFGDFREGYMVVDRVGMRITRDEITTPGYVKFYVRKRVGGKIRNSQAIKLLKIATS
jgi:HK97 family phage major capsid protein